MKYENIRYFELTFIKDLEEIKKQIKNTILFLYLSEKYGLTVLSEYLQSTQYGYTASAKTIGKIKLLRITDITEGKVNWNSVPYCDCSKPDKYLLYNNDILIARTGGTTGKSFIVKNVPSNIVYASYLIRLRIKDENNADFISAFLSSYTYWSQLVDLKRGAAQPNVNAEKLKKIIIPKCSPDIQNRIASYLNGKIIDEELDNRIQEILKLFDTSQLLKGQQSNQLDLLKKLRQQILQDAVQGKLVQQDPNDEPAGLLLERIKAEKEKLILEKKIKKDKPLPEIKPEEIPFEIPENWVWCKLGEPAQIIRGISPKYSEGGDYRILNQKCIRWYFINEEDSKSVNSEWYNSLPEERFATYHDVLVNSTGEGTIGRAAIVDKEDFKLPFDSHILKLRSRISQKYLCYLINSMLGQAQVESLKGATSTKQTELGVNNLCNFHLPLPPTNEQNRIVVKIEKLMTICDELEQSIQQNQKYTQELLQVALKEALEPKKK